MAEALEGAGRVILALPTQSLRGVLERLAALPPEGRVFLNLAKGIETRIVLFVMAASNTAGSTEPHKKNLRVKHSSHNRSDF